MGGNANLDTTEFLHANGSVSNGPTLSTGNDGFCAVQLINNDGSPGNVLLLGGNRGGSHKKVQLYDITTGLITSQEDMLFDHSLSACTVFYSHKHDGRPVVYNGAGEYGGFSAEILDYQVTSTWEQSKFIRLSQASKK